MNSLCEVHLYLPVDGAAGEDGVAGLLRGDEAIIRLTQCAVLRQYIALKRRVSFGMHWICKNVQVVR